MTRAWRVVVGIAGLGLVVACATAGGPEGERRSADAVPVEVQNHTTQNVVVYAHYGGQRYRLGEATAFGAASLSLPPAVTGRGAGVRFQLDLIGPPEGFLSESFVLAEGDAVLIHVQPNVRQSTVSIR